MDKPYLSTKMAEYKPQLDGGNHRIIDGIDIRIPIDIKFEIEPNPTPNINALTLPHD